MATIDLEQSPAGDQWSGVGMYPRHGVAVPISALRGTHGGGIGEYRDLLPLIDWCAEVGFGVIQLLPINDSGPDPSPYSALSAFALNPLYLSLGPNPELNGRDTIDYKAVRKWKLAALAQKSGGDEPEWLVPYALFKTLREIYKRKAWWDWPIGPNANLTDQYPEAVAHHAAIQSLCIQEMAAVRAHADAKGVLLMGDIPILLSANSTDVWWHQKYFDRSVTVGAPPDQYSDEGQNWGFPPYRWDALKADDFSWWRERLHHAQTYFHIYRIDHIVGFFRFWQIPHDQTGRRGRFVPEVLADALAQGSSLLQMLLESSNMLPIGEDLGAVPPEVRDEMTRLGICGTKVMRWERDWEGDQSFTPIAAYPRESLTCVSTHDSEPLALWWSTRPNDAKQYAAEQGWTWTPRLSSEHHRQILADSHRSESLFHINPIQEYLALVPGLTRDDPAQERINVPGTASDRNWTYRLLPSMETLVHNEELKQSIKEILP